MATLLNATATLNHSVFQEPGRRISGLPAPLGIAYAFGGGNFSGGSTDDSNQVLIRPQGNPAYVYTLADVFLEWYVFSNASSAAGSEQFQAWLTQLNAHYVHYPVFGSIGDQAFHDVDESARIQPQRWAFDGKPVWTNYVTVSGQPYPKWGRFVMQPVRSPNHPGNFPCTIPPVWDQDKSPEVQAYCGERITLVSSSPLRIRFGVTYAYWDPRDRVSSNAYAELPVRGT